MTETIKINRAPVLTLWAAVVAERLGFDRETALTLGQAVAGLSAYAKGVAIGIIEPKPDLVREQGDQLAEGERCTLTCSAAPCPWCGPRTGCGRWAGTGRAIRRGSRSTSPPSSATASTRRGRRWPSWRQPMSPRNSTATVRLYEMFRPAVPAGESGWGAKGELDLDTVRAMAGKALG